MGNAEAKEVKYATVTNRSDGEGCNSASEERSDLIGALMKVAERTSSHPIQLEEMDPEICLKLESDLAMYFGVMRISLLALTKAALLPEKLSSQVEFFLTRFLRSVDCSLLRKWIEKTRGMRWPDIFPTVRLVYSPLCRASLCPIDLLCLEAGVCNVHIILSRDNEIQTLIKQGLLDYLICLPWHISEGLEARKREKLLLEKLFYTPLRQHYESMLSYGLWHREDLEKMLLSLLYTSCASV
eukprot:Em0002g1509a